MSEGAALRDVAHGLGLLLSTQSFVARALLGSLCAALLAAVAVRLGWVRSTRVRRGLVLAPIATAVAAAVASAGDSFLPPLLVATSGVGEPFEVFGEEYTVLKLEWLLVGYAGIASFLLLRRALGLLATRAYIRRAITCDIPEVVTIVRRLACKLGVGAPEVLLVQDCPGGAFTAGVRDAVICLDPALMDDLDAGELEALLAHEVAHIARRDVGTNIGVGLIRDLTFFIPPLHVAARWLRREQEHAADDLASSATGRPATLASSILKVWEGRTARGQAMVSSMACATMVPAPLPVPAGMPARILRQGGLRGGAKLIAARVVRLIEQQAGPSVARERIEMGLFGLTLCALTAVTVVLPTQMGGQSLLLGQWSRPAASPVESPAMTTFREVAGTLALADTPVIAADPCPACLLPETAGQWRHGQAPAAPVRTSAWRDGGGFAWEDGNPALGSAPRAEPLWGVDSGGGRVGVFVVR